jgi:hypothetical protein
MHDRTTEHSRFFPSNITALRRQCVALVLYMEWELLDDDGDTRSSRLVAELCDAKQGRLVGSRGVHASLVLQDGPRLVVIMVLDSRSMLEAHARWTRLRVQRLLGARPSRQEAFDLLGAVEGAARLTSVMGARRAAQLALGADISYDASYSVPENKEEGTAATAARTRGGGHGGDLAPG